MILKLLAVLLCQIVFVFVSIGQTCELTYSGEVLNEDLTPISGAVIIMKPGTTGAITDAAGKFRIEHLCSGEYFVTIQFLGYKATTIKINLVSSQTEVYKLEEDRKELSEVIIKDHHDAAKVEYITHINEITYKKLAERAGTSLGDLLSSIPGVTTIRSGPGISKPMIHGLHSQRILILNNGIRQEGQQWGADHAPEIDPMMASTLVVIKDASAIRHGAEAVGGVIMVNPAELPESAGTGGYIHQVYQSNSRGYLLSGLIESRSVKVPELAWRIQGTGRYAGDYHTPNYNLTNTASRELDFSGGLAYHKEKYGFDLYISRFNNTTGILKGTAIGNLDDLVIAMERIQPLYTREFSYSIGAPRQESIHSLIKWSGHATRTTGEWRWQYALQKNVRQEFDLRIGNLTTKPAMDLSLVTNSLDVEWESNHQGKVTAVAGMNSIFQLNRNTPGTQRIPFIPDYNIAGTGLFSLVNFEEGRIKANAGMRLDYRNYLVSGFDYKNELYTQQIDYLNWSASAGIQVSGKSFRHTLTASSSWRPPHVAELFSLGTHQSVAAIEYGLLLNKSTNEVLSPEQVGFKPERSYKLVYTSKWESEKFSLEVSPFLNYLDNYIYLRPEGVTVNVRGAFPYYRYNQTTARFVGADITSRYQVLNQLVTSLSVSLLNATDLSRNDYLTYIPASRGEWTIRYELTKFRFFAEGSVQYVTRQNQAPLVISISEVKAASDNGTPLPDQNFDFKPAPDGYTLVNLSTGLTLKWGRTFIDIRVASTNLLNTLYRDYTNRFRYYADERGRNNVFAIKFNF